MPEGDSIHRTATALRILVGETVTVETPHPRAMQRGLAEQLDGRRLVSVEARGKNLLLTFEGGIVLRSHLRMNGRWQVRDAGASVRGKPWLILRGNDSQAVQWNGPILELGRTPQSFDAIRRLGPDIMANEPDVEEALTRVRKADQERELGEALLDQRLVAGIGNKWKSEALFSTGLSPWGSLGRMTDDELRDTLAATSKMMQAPPSARRPMVYRRTGRPCRVCQALIRSRAQGDDARLTYWCPQCQEGESEN